MAFLTYILFDEDPNTQCFDENLLQESLLQMLAQQHIKLFPTTGNNVVKSTGAVLQLSPTMVFERCYC